jgi:hypothetical protein
MSVDLGIAIVSLVLSIVFWWNAKSQAAAAEKTLEEVKSQIIGWQNELNKTAIEMLSSSPAMVAQKTALASSEAEAQFTASMAVLVETLAKADSSANLDAIGTLLKHHEDVVLGKQKLGFEAATKRQ